MKKAKLFAILLGGIGLCSDGISQTWTFTNGPNRPHEVLDIAIGKNGSTQKLYATDVDTLKISTDAGANWSPSGASVFLAPVVTAAKVADPQVALVAKFHGMNPSTDAVFRTSNSGDIWSSVTPSASYAFQPQRIMISPQNPDIAFLGTERTIEDIQTTLWRSSDGGANWSALNFFRDDAQTNVNDVVAYPGSSYAGYVWVGGSVNHITETPDMQTEGSIERKGVWRSTNSGVNWTFQGGAMSGTDRNVTALALSISTNDALFAATMDGSQTNIYQSTDYGVTWTLSTNRPLGPKVVRSMKVNPYNANQILVGTDNGVYMSTDRGGTWESENTGLPAGAFNVFSIAYDLADATGKTVYIATGTSVYKGSFGTSDWTWTASVTGSNYMNATALAAHNGILYSASSGWDAITKFSGSSWSIVSSTMAFVPAAVAASTSASYAYASGALKGKGVIYRTTNSGTSWIEEEKITTNNTTFSTIVADPKSASTYVFAGLSGTGVSSDNFFRSTNNGDTWTNSGISGVSGVPVNAMAVDASTGSSNSTKIYAGLGSTKGIYKSTDAGATFSSVAMNTYTIAAIALNSNTSTLANTIYIAESNRLWKSTNGLSSEPSQLTIPFTSAGGAKCILMHPSYPGYASHVWIITGNGQQIYKTTDGGTSWTEVSTASLPKPLHLLRSDPLNNALIYVSTSGGVYKVDPVPEKPTGISGTIVNPGVVRVDWTSNLEADLQHYQVRRYFQTCNYYCPDIKQCALPTTINTIATPTSNTYTDDERVIVCGGVGTLLGVVAYYTRAVDNGNGVSDSSNYILFRRGEDDPEMKINIDPKVAEIPPRFSLAANYPNPFNPMTMIRYELAEDAVVRLVVIDILGREVSVLVNEKQSAGYKSINFDASNLASGVYLYKLTAGQFTEVKKMIVTK